MVLNTTNYCIGTMRDDDDDDDNDTVKIRSFLCQSQTCGFRIPIGPSLIGEHNERCLRGLMFDNSFL
jgi:hypothetical protein